eukprot:6012324-Amphidinium_carterae.1
MSDESRTAGLATVKSMLSKIRELAARMGPPYPTNAMPSLPQPPVSVAQYVKLAPSRRHIQ